MKTDIFREYDIRGIVGEELTEETVEIVARSIGTFFSKNGAKIIAVGFDARESSPKFCEILISALNKCGCDAVLIGKIPTPVLYHAAYTHGVDGAVMITGSHNPKNHNGFKICLGLETLYGARIQDIKKIALAKEFASGSGTSIKENYLGVYLDDLLGRIELGDRPLKVVVDAGNGMGGVTAVPVFEGLGVEVIKLYTDPDSNFPNHPPDPAVPENLKDAINAVRHHKADLAIAFDGDADRITAIDNTGRVIWGDELTTLFAKEVCKELGVTVIGEVKCSQTLFDEVERLGGKAIMCKAGHSIVKAKMKETGALLAGEMSGHIFFADRYYGFDDACYAGARLLEILSNTDKPLSVLVSELPQTFSTPEIRIPCKEEQKFEIAEQIAKEFENTNEVSTIDGARIKFEHGWGLVRPSNTQALLVLRFEASNEEYLTRIRNKVESRVELLIDQS